MSSNQIRLTLGMFTIYPAFGSISPGSAQTITVDSVAETQGVFAEVCIKTVLLIEYVIFDCCVSEARAYWLTLNFSILVFYDYV